MANATFTKGSAVEVSSDEPGFDGAWYTAIIVDEAQASPTRSKKKKKKTRYVIKYDTLFKEDSLLEPLTEVVDPSFVRPVPPRNVRRNDDAVDAKVAEVDGVDGGDGDFELLDAVDAYHRDGWWIGVVKNVIVEGGLRRYIVQFENPTEEFEFPSSKLRFHVDWIDCCWLVPPRKTPEHEIDDRNATDDAHSCLTTPSKTSLITDVHNGSPLYAKKNSRSRKRHESSSAVGTSVTYRRKKRRVNSVEDDSRGKIFQSSAGGHEVTTNIDEQPISVWYQGMHPHSVLKRSSRFSPPDHHDNPLNQAIVTGAGTTTDYQQDLPFIKRSPIWAAIGLYPTPPQKPHFSPLLKLKEDYREGYAIAHMVTYLNLVQRLSDLQLNDSFGTINNSLEILCDLETHGFDVGSIRARLNKLLLLKTKVCQDVDKLKTVEKELGECNHEKSLVEKEVDVLKVKMEELQEKMVQAVSMQKVKEEQSMKLQSNLRLVTRQIKDSELAFEKLVATPF